MKSSQQQISPGVRVLIVSRSEITRAGLRLLLERRPGLDVVGECSISDAPLTIARVLPDILLVEIEASAECDLQLLTALVQSAKSAGVLVLSGACDPEAFFAAVRVGVMGVVTKTDSLENLFGAIQRVGSGGVWLERSVMEGILTRTTNRGMQPAAPAESLTTREREVLQLVGEALNNRQIAQRLFVAETTVRHHLTSVFGKLGVSSRLELVKYAYSNGLVPLRPAGTPRAQSRVRAS